MEATEWLHKSVAAEQSVTIYSETQATNKTLFNVLAPRQKENIGTLSANSQLNIHCPCMGTWTQGETFQRGARLPMKDSAHDVPYRLSEVRWVN